MIVNVNCIFLDKNKFNCNHKDMPKNFFLFKPVCVEPFKECILKKKNRRRPLYSPPPQSIKEK
jgi:hypothetical protein